ncbi:MAG: cation:proton antiporter [Terriglobia bacterium]
MNFKRVTLWILFITWVVLSPRFAPITCQTLSADASRATDSPATSNTDVPVPPPANHGGQAALVLIALVIVLMGAKLGGDFFERLHQPAVLGELLFGVALGNLSLLGFHGLDYLKTNEVINALAELGVIFLLFEVGLESNIKEMMEVGATSFLVATVGVICPLLLGWWVSSLFLTTSGPLVHVFVGATLCATSVGITARVLKDLGKASEKEARIILGAAVIDDVMGLVVLATVSGIIRAADRGGVGISPLEIGFIILKAIVFFVVSISLGSKIAPQLFRLASLLRIRGMLLVTSICFCFFLPIWQI